MGYREERGYRCDIAKQAAKEALVGFQGRVSLIPTAGLQRDKGLRWMTSEEAIKELEAISLSFGRGSIVPALSSAYELLRGLSVPKQILLLSDMARSDWQISI